MFIGTSQDASSASSAQASSIFVAKKMVAPAKKDYINEPIIVISSDEEGSTVHNNFARKGSNGHKEGGSRKTNVRGSSGLRKVELTQVGSVSGGGLVKNKSSNRLASDQHTRREERGSSFCDILSSSKMSSSRVGDSHSSINLEDEASSDAGASIGDEFSNGGVSRGIANHSNKDDDCDDEDLDLEQKIRFFFQRIEQQETPSTASAPTISDQDCNRSI
jgi:hypothetical protein